LGSWGPRLSGRTHRRGCADARIRWSEADGEVRFHPDEAVCTAIRAIFTRFAELVSACSVWLTLCSESPKFPWQHHYGAPIRWIDPSYHAIHKVLRNPVYAGAYVYGKTRHELILDGTGQRKKRTRKLAPEQWLARDACLIAQNKQVLIRDHHQGYIDWDTYESNRARMASNTKPQPHQRGSGAVREGSALLQGIAVCGHCGRKLRTHYTGRTASPGYHCSGSQLVEGRGCHCLSIGAVQIDEAVVRAVLDVLAPSGIEAALAADLPAVWQAPTTTARDKKELLRAILEEVIIAVQKQEGRTRLTLRWRGGAVTEIALDLPRQRQATVRTDEDIIELLRRLAAHYPDAVIAGILNRQGRHTAYGHRFTAIRVASLRKHRNIPRYKPPAAKPDGDLLTIDKAAQELGVAASTIHRWLADGIIRGEQRTLGAPWRIRITDELRSRVAEEAPEGYLTMYQTMRMLGVSRQTVLQRVKRGEIAAVHVRRGRQKGLLLKVTERQRDLFGQT
jgi:predicted DNA-binding transcriptional regulator AlpA